MAVDASIPLQVQVPDYSQQNDPRRMLTMANALMQFRQAQQQQQTQNALRALYADPSNLDPSGGLTKNALGKVMQIDPGTGIKLQQSQLQLQAQQTKAFAEKHAMLNDIRSSALTAYEDAIKSGLPEPQAREKAREVQDEGLDEARKSGLFSEQEQSSFATDFDPVRARANAVSYQQWLDQQEKLKADKRAEAELGIREKAEGRAETTFKQEQAGLGLSADAIQSAAQDYRSTGRLPPAASRQEIAKIIEAAKGFAAPRDFGQPTPVTVKDASGATRTVEAIYDKEGARWLTAQDRKPIVGEVLPATETRAEQKGWKEYQDDKGDIYRDNTGAGLTQKKVGDHWEDVDRMPASVQQVGSASAFDPEAVENTAQMIANYDLATLKGFSLKTGFGQAVLKRIRQLNPNFDETQYDAKRAAVTAFAKGRQGDTTRSLNVVVQHLDLVGQLGQAIHNGDVQTVNRLKNAIKEEFGNADVTNFDVAKGIVGDEIVKATIGYAGGMADRENAQNQLSRAKSWDQLAGVIKTAQGLAGGQLMGLRKQYEAGTGLKNFDQKYLMPETISALERAGGGGPVQIKSAADYEKLAKGQHYIDPNGVERVKQ